MANWCAYIQNSDSTSKYKYLEAAAQVNTSREKRRWANADSKSRQRIRCSPVYEPAFAFHRLE